MPGGRSSLPGGRQPGRVLVVKAPRVVRASLTVVRPPHPLVVVARGWPSNLISVLALDIPLAAAFFPSSLHRYFKPPTSNPDVKWLPTEAFRTSVFRDLVVFVVTGDLAFIKAILPLLPSTLRVIVGLEMPLRSSSPNYEVPMQRARTKALRYLENKHNNLDTAILRDASFGGATDASFVFAFGKQLNGHVIPSEPSDVTRVLRHYLDGGTSGWFDRVRLQDLPSLDDDSSRIIWGDSDLPIHRRGKQGSGENADKFHWDKAGKFIRQEGLFPCHNPRVQIACPSYFNKGMLVVRSMALSELLRLYQLPLSMDEHFQMIDVWSSLLPFEQAASSVVFTSILRQLWGVNVGGLGGSGSAESLEVNYDQVQLSAAATIGEESGGLDDGVHSRFRRER